jgi:cytochrome c5
VSNQDTHFFNTFSLVIGVLVVVAICLFALARVVAGETQGAQVKVEEAYQQSVALRIQPLSREAVAGKDNSALAIVASKPAAAGSALPIPKTGTEVFDQVCSACHTQGIAGAPKAGDAAAWAPHVAKGKPALYQHALQGITEGSAVMPPKGGRTDIPDDLIKGAVDHMLEMIKH